MDIKQFVEKSAQIEYTYKVTSEVYYSFQRCSNDYNPLHTDDAFSKEKGFEGRVMYGNILNAFISHFVGMLLPTRGVMIQRQDIDFHQPVFFNDEIKLQAKVDDMIEPANVVVYKFIFYRGTQKIAKGHVQIGLLAGKEDSL